MLDNAHTYSKRWRISFSTGKSKVVVFGESKEENLKSVHKRIFKLGDTTLEEVQSVKHIGAFSSSEHRIKTDCNKSHNIIASLSTAGLRPKGLHPMVAGALWNKLGISAVLYGSEVWYGTTKTDIVKLEKAQIRKVASGSTNENP